MAKISVFELQICLLDLQKSYNLLIQENNIINQSNCDYARKCKELAAYIAHHEQEIDILKSKLDIAEAAISLINSDD